MFRWSSLATRLASEVAARPAAPAEAFAHSCERLVGPAPAQVLAEVAARPAAPAEAFARSCERLVDPAPARVLAEAAPLLDAWLDAQRVVLTRGDAASTREAAHAAEALGPALLASPTVPAEVSSALAGAFRAALVLLALGRAAESEAFAAGRALTRSRPTRAQERPSPVPRTARVQSAAGRRPPDATRHPMPGPRGGPPADGGGLRRSGGGNRGDREARGRHAA